MEIIKSVDLFLEHRHRIASNLPYSLFINGPEYYITYNTISNNCTGLNYITKNKLNISKITKLDNYIFEKAHKNGFIYRKHKPSPSPAELLNALFNNNVQDNNIFDKADSSQTVYNPYYRKGIIISMFSTDNMPIKMNPNFKTSCNYTDNSTNWDISLVDTTIYDLLQQTTKPIINTNNTYRVPILCPPYILRTFGLKEREQSNIPSFGQHGRVISFSYIDSSIVTGSLNPSYLGNFGKLFIIYNNYNTTNEQLNKSILGSFTRDGWTGQREALFINNQIIPAGGKYNLNWIDYYFAESDWCKWLKDNLENENYSNLQQKKIKQLYGKCYEKDILTSSCTTTTCCSTKPSGCGKKFFTDLSEGLNDMYEKNKSISNCSQGCWNELIIKSWTYNEKGMNINNHDYLQEIIDTSLISQLGWKDKTILNDKIPILAFGTWDNSPYNNANIETKKNIKYLKNILNNVSSEYPIVYLDVSNYNFTDV